MNSLAMALAWNGRDVMLSMFVVRPVDSESRIVPPAGVAAPREIRYYAMQDEAGVVPEHRVTEIDLLFDEYPADLETVLRVWLTAAVRAGAIIAWFGFEGSFHFNHLLTPDIADQVYAAAAEDQVAVAVDERLLESNVWADQLARIRQALFAPPPRT